jgi:hypothetical protein
MVSTGEKGDCMPEHGCVGKRPLFHGRFSKTTISPTVDLKPLTCLAEERTFPRFINEHRASHKGNCITFSWGRVFTYFTRDIFGPIVSHYDKINVTTAKGMAEAPVIT